MSRNSYHWRMKTIVSEKARSHPGLRLPVKQFKNVTLAESSCNLKMLPVAVGAVGIRRLVFGRIPKRGGKRGKLVLAFGVFHAFLGASFPQRVACRFFSNRNSTARGRPSAPGRVWAPLAGRGRPGPARWLGDVAPSRARGPRG